MIEKPIVHGVMRRLDRGRVRDVLGGKIHESFTTAADQLFQRGYLTEKERIALSGIIGDVLPKFQEQISDKVGNRPVETDDLRAIAERSMVRRTHSRSKCMECDRKPEIAVHWANGYGMAWFCKDDFKAWLEEDERDVVGIWTLEDGVCPEDIRKTPKGTTKVRKLGNDIPNKEIYKRVGIFRRVDRHYGPGPHPGTGTPQDVHGGGVSAGIGNIFTEEEAEQLGRKAFERGISSASALDKEFMDRLPDREPDTSAIPLLDAWIKGWTKANLEAPLLDDDLTERGGPGSGHYGHRGDPGKVGGSLPRSAGTHLGGVGVPDFSDNSKKAFISQRTMIVDGEMIVALVYLRRMEVFKLKPYRLESRWHIRNPKGPATGAQVLAGANLVDDLEADTLTMMDIQGWKKSEQGNRLYLAPWGVDIAREIKLVQKHHGPGPHPGTGTPQEVHAGGKGGRAKVSGGTTGPKTYPKGVGPLSQEEELRFTSIQALLNEPTQRSADGVFGMAYTEEKWTTLAQQMIDGLPPEVQQAMADADKKVREGTQTIEAYTDPETGEWQPEREALHQRIVRQIMDEAGEPPKREGGTKPIAWITGGLPGAGKTSVMDARGEEISGEGTVRIDSDRIKAMLPEYEGWNAALLHEESSHIVGELMRRTREGGYNFIYDATLKTTASAEALINEVKNAGYSANVIYVDIPMAMAIERSAERFMNGGRYVSPMYVATHDSKNIRTLSQLRDDVDYWEHWDNSQPRGQQPTLLATGRSKP